MQPGGNRSFSTCVLRRDWKWLSSTPAARAVSAPTVEYDAALMMVHRAHAAPASAVEYDAALVMAHQACAAAAPVIEYDATSTETHSLCAAPTIAIQYGAYAARAVPSPLVDGPVVKVRACPLGAGSGEDKRDPTLADY